jgi:hypothetical protein
MIAKCSVRPGGASAPDGTSQVEISHGDAADGERELAVCT